MKTLTVPGRYENLEKLAEFARQCAQNAGLDSFAVYSVETAVEEACSNIIEHAYGGESAQEIRCTCQSDATRIIIQLHDHGKPFDPKRVPLPNTKAKLKNRPSHGLGLYFIYQWMDEVNFQFDPAGGNTLTLVKLKGQKAP